ncbi:MAG: GNAT family N-acetyltransferase [Verrucomicrobia bacterium]|nr:GNAT family N-acetyltransferase [Verrucomicrobiota bacterium]
MNANQFAGWLERQGHRVVRTASSFWYNAGPRILQSFPYHRIVVPGEEEIAGLLRENKAVGLRYSAPVGNSLGRVSYHSVVYAPYSIERLSSNARSCTNRGLRHCQVQRIEFERLEEDGWSLQRDTLARQHREATLDERQWQRICRASREVEGFEVWGALVQGKLAASILVAQVEDTCYYLYPQSHRDYFKLHVNNALVYRLTVELLSRPGVKSIFYGLESLDAPASVDEFKFRMGFEARPVRQRVVFHPWLPPRCVRLGHSLLRRLHRSRPNAAFLAKAEGFFRFHVEGSGQLPARGPRRLLTIS